MDEGPKETSIASLFGRSLRRSSSPREPPCRQIESDREVRVKSLRAALAPAPRGMRPTAVAFGIRPRLFQCTGLLLRRDSESGKISCGDGEAFRLVAKLPKRARRESLNGTT